MAETVSENDKSLNELVSEACSKVLKKDDVLGSIGIPVTTENTDKDLKRPVVVVSANTAGERIFKSGVFDIQLSIQFLSTIKTTENNLKKWDGIIWNTIADINNFATELQNEVAGIKVYSVINPTSAPTNFSDKKRDIVYNVTVVAIKVQQ